MKTLLFSITFFLLIIHSNAQTNIEHEVYSNVLELRDKYKTNEALVDSIGGTTTTGENSVWESNENKIKTSAQLKALNFNTLKFVKIEEDPTHIIATWVDCRDLIVLEIRKKTKSKKLYCELFKETKGNVTRQELLDCK